MDRFGSRPRGCAMAFALAGLATLNAPSAFAHGDHGGGGGTVLPAGVVLVGVDYDYVKYKQISDARLTALAAAGVEEVHSMKTITVPALSLAYGITKDLTIAARLPYLMNKDIRETDPDNASFVDRGGVYGFGDISFTGTWRFINDVQRGFDAAVILGVKTPTGRTSAYDKNGELFEVHHQPGSGSWDPMFGGALSQQFGKLLLSANALYTVSTEGARETVVGDRLGYGVTAAYRILESGGGHSNGHAMHLGANFDGMMRHGGVDHAHEKSTPMALDVSLGLEGFWSAKVKEAGEFNQNTGGNVLYLTPGVRLTFDRWTGYLNVGIPVARDFNGIQSEPDYHVTTGMAVRF